MSTDSDLELCIQHMSQSTPPVPTSSSSVNEVIEKAVDIVAIEVGKTLLRDRVTLLSTVRSNLKKYLKELREIVPDHTAEKAKHSTTSRWILSHLKSRLHHHINYTCTIRKCVTRQGTNFTSIITKMLWKQQNYHENTKNECTNHTHFNEVMDDRVHKQVKSFLGKEEST